MTNEFPNSLLLIDVGSSRVKLGWYPAGNESSDALPAPDSFLELCGTEDAEALSQWTNELPLASASCLIASVHRTTSQWLTNQLAACGLAKSTIRELRHRDLPISIHTDHPDRVGIDRLLNAVAANHLRQPNRPAIVVDMGSAITVDLVATDGAFEGGAILPGFHLSARALQTGTDVLPLVELDISALPPTALGKTTEAAIAAGVYWGAIGAVRELINQLSLQCESPPDLYITGGDASQFTAALSTVDLPAKILPHMVLAGIRITAQELS